MYHVPGTTLTPHALYEKGISMTKAAMRAIEKRLIRNPLLPKYDILIEPLVALWVHSLSRITLRQNKQLVNMEA